MRTAEGPQGRLARLRGIRRRVEALAGRVPAPFRFLAVGSLGLSTDMAAFTIVSALEPNALVARALSISLATLLTWRLNRTLTFAASGRRQDAEAARYGAVTAVSQGVSYLAFAALVLTVAKPMPHLAILAGACLGAVFSYNGHRLFSFAPRRAEGAGA